MDCVCEVRLSLSGTVYNNIMFLVINSACKAVVLLIDFIPRVQKKNAVFLPCDYCNQAHAAKLSTNLANKNRGG